MRNSGRLGSYSRTMPRALWQSQGGGQCLMSEVLLYMATILVSARVVFFLNPRDTGPRRPLRLRNGRFGIRLRKLRD